LRVWHYSGLTQGVKTFSANYVEYGGVSQANSLLNEWLKRLLVAPQKLGYVATFCRLGKEVHTGKGALHDHSALLLQEGVLN
jgi:hypothetical protein